MLDKMIVHFAQTTDGLIEAEVLAPNEPLIKSGGTYADYVDAIVNFTKFAGNQEYVIATKSQIMTEMTEREATFDFVRGVFK